MATVKVLGPCNSKISFDRGRKRYCNNDKDDRPLECKQGKEEIVGCLPYSSH